MWRGNGGGHPNFGRFFLQELGLIINLESLYYELYILVSKLGFSKTDVLKMTKLERVLYITYLKREKEAENNAIEQHRGSR